LRRANSNSVTGIMLCRGNKKTVSMFDLAWREYKVTDTAPMCLMLRQLTSSVCPRKKAIDKPIKHNPGKDQNKVVGAMRVSR
jgi:hypothetical protein